MSQEGDAEMHGTSGSSQTRDNYNDYHLSTSPSGMLRMPGDPSISSPSTSDGNGPQEESGSLPPVSEEDDEKTQLNYAEQNATTITISNNLSGVIGTASFVSSLSGIDNQRYAMATNNNNTTCGGLSASHMDFMMTQDSTCFNSDITYATDMMNTQAMSIVASSEAPNEQIYESTNSRHMMQHIQQQHPTENPCVISANLREQQLITGGVSPAYSSYQATFDMYNPNNHQQHSRQCFVGTEMLLANNPPCLSDQTPHLRSVSSAILPSPRMIPFIPPPFAPHQNAMQQQPPLPPPPPMLPDRSITNKDSVVQLHPSGQYVLPFARHHLPQYPRHIMTAQQNMLINTVNPNAPPVLLCGVCRQPAEGDPDDSILCEGGCDFFYHRECVGLTKEAALALKAERYAIWVCDNCHKDKQIPAVLFRRRD